MVGKDKTLENSYIKGGLILAIAGILYTFAVQYMDYTIHDISGSYLYQLLGVLAGWIVFDIVPFLIIGVGVVVLFWGLWKASRK